MGNEGKNVHGKSFKVHLGEMPDGLQPYSVVNVEEVIVKNKCADKQYETIKRVVVKEEKGGHVSYYDETTGTIELGGSVPLTKEEYEEVLKGNDEITVRNYEKRWYKFNGIHFYLRTIGRTDIKLITVLFGSREEKLEFKPPVWMQEINWNSVNAKKGSGSSKA